MLGQLLGHLHQRAGEDRHRAGEGHLLGPLGLVAAVEDAVEQFGVLAEQVRRRSESRSPRCSPRRPGGSPRSRVGIGRKARVLLASRLCPPLASGHVPLFCPLPVLQHHQPGHLSGVSEPFRRAYVCLRRGTPTSGGVGDDPVAALPLGAVEVGVRAGQQLGGEGTGVSPVEAAPMLTVTSSPSASDRPRGGHGPPAAGRRAAGSSSPPCRRPARAGTPRRPSGRRRTRPTPPGRSASRSSSATAHSTRSPTSWERVSLIRLKWSRSRRATVTGSASEPARSSSRGELLVDEAPVVEPGERVAQRELPVAAGLPARLGRLVHGLQRAGAGVPLRGLEVHQPRRSTACAPRTPRGSRRGRRAAPPAPGGRARGSR